MQRFISDKNGKSYEIAILETNSLLLIKLFDQEDLVGELKCLRESPAKLLIADILIEDSMALSTANFWSVFIRMIPRLGPKPINYRNRGLGSALLKVLIEHTRADGVQHLHGRVVQQDLENTPNLLQWYQKHGFEIKLPSLVDAKDTVAWIHLDI